MIEFSNTLMIKLKVKEVFDFLDNIRNFPKWNYAVKEITEVETDNDVRCYRLYRGEMGPPVENIAVTERIKDKKLTMEISGGWFPYSMKYELTPTSNGTILENTVKIKPSGMTRIITKMFQRRFKNAVGQNLRVLKRILEK